MNADKKRFGQGNEVDRARHIFDRDCRPFRLIHSCKPPEGRP